MWNSLIAGAGPEEANLRRLARELGIAQKVTFVPNLSDLNESLAAMDIFCLPSLQQGLGTIMLEPMAMAKPVIATGVGGVYSVVEDGRTGLMVPPSNSQALAEKILDLLNHPDRAGTIGEAARARVVSDFSVEKMIRQTAGLYRELLDAEKSPATNRRGYDHKIRRPLPSRPGPRPVRSLFVPEVCHPMHAEIISIGSELTTGAKLDTNSQWLSQELAGIGVPVHYHTTVADDLAANVAVLTTAVSRADIVLITGGLGPTQDDLTREAIAEMLAVPLELHEPSLEFHSRPVRQPQS